MIAKYAKTCRVDALWQVFNKFYMFNISEVFTLLLYGTSKINGEKQKQNSIFFFFFLKGSIFLKNRHFLSKKGVIN